MSKKNKTKIKNKNESVSLAKRTIKASPLYFVVFVLWGIYLILTFTAPNTSTQLQLSPQGLIWLRLSVAIPYLLTWLAAAYAFIKIKRYALAIAPSKESRAFSKIGIGISILLGGLMLATFSGSIRTHFVGHDELRSVFTIINNYCYVFPYLFAFLYLLKGALILVRQEGGFAITKKQYLFYGIPLVIFAYFWLELIFSNQYRIIAGGGSMFASYYLKDSLLILTLVLPSLFTWKIGLIALMQLRRYYEKVTGILYKRALFSLVLGFFNVILASIFLQALLSLGARRLLDLGLEKLLALIYLFLLLQAVGFLLLSRGARKLTKIEAV